MEQKLKGGTQREREKNPEKSHSWPDDVTRDTGSVRQSSAELSRLSEINAAQLQHTTTHFELHFTTYGNMLKQQCDSSFGE